MKQKKLIVIYKGEEYETDGLSLLSNPPKYALYKNGNFVTYALESECKVKEVVLYGNV